MSEVGIEPHRAVIVTAVDHVLQASGSVVVVKGEVFGHESK